MANNKGKSPTSERSFDRELDKFERMIDELRVHYEQYFIDIQPLPPDKLHHQTRLVIRKLLKAPFKNSADRFRLRTLIQRYQSFDTYWERIIKQREEGTYTKDVFRSEMRQKMLEDAEKQTSSGGAAEKSIRELFNTYQTALNKTGVKTDNINFDFFKKSLIEKAKQLKAQHGVKKLHYKVLVKNGKVVLKASAKS